MRWKYGAPPSSNANFAWLQHIAHHLSPTGTAGVVLANGSMSSTQSGEGDIRQAMVEADLVDCMIALPGQLFYATQIPVCLWFLARTKAPNGFRDRKGEVLFIDARKLGQMVDRVRRQLTGDDIARIADTYHAWRGERDAIDRRGAYSDIPGFCKSTTKEVIERHSYVLTPGRYVGEQEVEEDGLSFDEKFAALKSDLETQFEESERLSSSVKSAIGVISNRV